MDVIAVLLTIFGTGFAVGYGVRALISSISGPAAEGPLQG
jgi:hypothetical protein